MWSVHTVTGSVSQPTTGSAQALICVAGFELSGCRFVRGHSRVSVSHPVARAFPEAFAVPRDGRLRMRGRLRDLACKVRASRRESRRAEDAIWSELASLLEA